MMSNTSPAATFGKNLQHNFTTGIDYLHQGGTPSLGAYTGIRPSENGLVMDKQNTPTFFASTPNPTPFYSTQLITQAPGTILITNNFGPDETAPLISGVNNNFSNSSIRILSHNNNNNVDKNRNNKNNNNLIPHTSLDELNRRNHEHQNYHHIHSLQLQSSAAPSEQVKMTSSHVTTSPHTQAPTATSTVVLDRINICINNHYGESSPHGSSPGSPSVAPLLLNQTQTTTSLVTNVESTRTSSLDTYALDMHTDEPDSTTSTHCDLVSIEDNPQNQDFDKPTMVFSKFEVKEDVFVHIDGQYFLGTIADKHCQQYLVQFDDKTDYWSNVEDLIKLSDGIANNHQPSCLACKKESDSDVVEICESCGRGYHQKCTEEFTMVSGVLMCKRCVKPMKWSAGSEEKEAFKSTAKPFKASGRKFLTEFPYDLNRLTWDEKHRVNLEMVYCYCGKSGQFDNNMIQCCKCLQWFHTRCVDCIKTLFRGDVFFVFGCSVCNNGKEFLRRISLEWVDLVHLILYNMAILKNFQKYHHLNKEIFPFALSKRMNLQLPPEITRLSDNEFKANILKTLQAHPKLFQCGREIKKDHSFWGLRINKPPQGPKLDIKANDFLSYQYIVDKLKIKILPHQDDIEGNIENCYKSVKVSSKRQSRPLTGNIKTDSIDDDDKFTSDDEIPIKLILEKVKTESSPSDTSENKTKLSEKINVTNKERPVKEEDNNEVKENKVELTITTKHQKSSRKRKAFTQSTSYKDAEKTNNLSRNICDSSSDENSSSSRGTLDLIIPPPKNFLGSNNPFRMVTPKKCGNTNVVSTKNLNSKYIINKTVNFHSSSIFNNILDLNSKLAALKNTGILPNISNNEFAKAAGRPRLVRTIKRRLSAKDIMIGPNQEIRRRRTRPLSSNIEVISTTTINPIPSNFFPIRTSTAPDSANILNNNKPTLSSSQSNSPQINSTTSSSPDCTTLIVPPQGRRLRKRPEKTSPQNSRRNSISSSSSSNSSASIPTPSSALPPTSQSQSAVPISDDLKQSVNKYFGAANRIENGEKFTIRARRRLTNGQTQYLIEWES